MNLAAFVDVIEPGSSAHVNALSNDCVQDTNQPRPYTDVPPKIARNGIVPSAQDIERSDAERGAEQ